MATSLEILAEFGFAEMETGGGCTALGKGVADGTEILVCDFDDECTAPTEASTTFCVGHYGADSNELSMKVGTFEEIASHIQSILMEAGDPNK